MSVRKDNLPHPIDTYVGARMRLRRIEMRLSQNALAAKLGITGPVSVAEFDFVLKPAGAVVQANVLDAQRRLAALGARA